MGTALGIGIGIPFTRRSGGGAANTARTQAFLTATGITDATIISALNAMDLALISAGLLPSGTGAGKIKALYPIVGGSATAHKYNFVDPRDLDAAFRLTFFGGWTHSSTGMLPNGTNAYADSFYNVLNNSVSNNDFHLSFYSRTIGGVAGAVVSIGVLDGSSETDLLIRWFDGNFYPNINENTYSNTYLNADTHGFYLASRNATNTIKGYKNNSKVVDIASTPTTRANFNIFVGARNSNGSASQFDVKECAFITIGNGLTEAEALSLYNDIQTFQTTLGRNV
jgi:hypothetical protein